ncbi:MAG: DUF4411 family protein [Caldiserica bacterium]|nr:DUF4411 family protein [Caldisericota bacterium]
MIYSIDTNFLIGAWVRHYPPDVMPGFWKELEHLAQIKAVFASIEVFNELKRMDDGISKWARQHKSMFVEPEKQVQDEMKMIMNRFPGLSNLDAGRSVADPWVIALAKVHGGVVVTEEKRHPGKQPHIPDVCDSLGIICMDILQFIRAQKWVFELKSTP